MEALHVFVDLAPDAAPILVAVMSAALLAALAHWFRQCLSGRTFKFRRWQLDRRWVGPAGPDGPDGEDADAVLIIDFDADETSSAVRAESKKTKTKKKKLSIVAEEKGLSLLEKREVLSGPSVSAKNVLVLSKTRKEREQSALDTAVQEARASQRKRNSQRVAKKQTVQRQRSGTMLLPAAIDEQQYAEEPETTAGPAASGSAAAAAAAAAAAVDVLDSDDEDDEERRQRKNLAHHVCVCVCLIVYNVVAATLLSIDNDEKTYPSDAVDVALLVVAGLFALRVLCMVFRYYRPAPDRVGPPRAADKYAVDEESPTPCVDVLSKLFCCPRFCFRLDFEENLPDAPPPDIEGARDWWKKKKEAGKASKK